MWKHADSASLKLSFESEPEHLPAGLEEPGGGASIRAFQKVELSATLLQLQGGSSSGMTRRRRLPWFEKLQRHPEMNLLAAPESVGSKLAL